MNEPSTQLTVGARINNVRAIMLANQDTMFAALPKHITPEKMIRICCSSIAKNPKLLDCSQSSLFSCITEAASLGLVPDGILGHAYLVPFKDKCTLIAGYKGLVALCRQSGEISSFYSHVVRPLDEFRYTLGTDKSVVHHPSDDEHDGTYSHAYAVAHYRNGGYDFEVMSYAEIKKHKEQYSKNYKKADSAWNTAPESMAMKTVIRRLIRLLPVSSDIQRLAAQEDEYEAGGYSDTHRRTRVERVQILPDDDQAKTTEPQSDDAEFQDASDAEQANQGETK